MSLLRSLLFSTRMARIWTYFLRPENLDPQRVYVLAEARDRMGLPA